MDSSVNSLIVSENIAGRALRISPENLHMIIKAARRKKGLSQEQLAVLCGFSSTKMSAIETNQRSPKWEDVCVIVKQLDCELILKL